MVSRFRLAGMRLLSFTTFAVLIATAMCTTGALAASRLKSDGSSKPAASQQQQQQQPQAPIAPLLPEPFQRVDSVDDFRNVVINNPMPVVFVLCKVPAACDASAASASAPGPHLAGAAKSLEGYVFTYYADARVKSAGDLFQMYGQGMQTTEGAAIQQADSVPVVMLFNPDLEKRAEGYVKMPMGYGGALTAFELTRWFVAMTSTSWLQPIDSLLDVARFNARYGKIAEPYGMGQVILLTAENVTSPVFKALSNRFRYVAQFGVVRGVPAGALAKAGGALAAATSKVDTTDMSELEKVLAYYSVSAALPAIVTISADGVDLTVHSGDDALGGGMQKLHELVATVAAPFEKMPDLMRAVLQEDEQRVAAEKEARRRQAEQGGSSGSSSSSGSGGGPSGNPIVHVATTKEWRHQCGAATTGRTCIVVFADGELSDAKRDDLRAASSRFAKLPGGSGVQILVVDGPKNFAFASFFEAGLNGFPAVVYVQPGRGTYHPHIGPFTADGIVAFYKERLRATRGRPYAREATPLFSEFEDREAADRKEEARQTRRGGAGSSSGMEDEEEIVAE